MVQKGDKRVGIIGGGISGMSAAWELSRKGIQVDLFERDVHLGGLAGWFDVNGSTLEKFYHHLYNLDQDLIRLIQEVGLGSNLVFRRTNTGAFYVNKIYRLSSPLDLIKYKPLPFLDRLKMGMLVLKARKVKDWKELDNMTARDWIVQNSSQAVFDIVWSPLFRSKFGKYADDISAAWLWSKLVQRGLQEQRRSRRTRLFERWIWTVVQYDGEATDRTKCTASINNLRLKPLSVKMGRLQGSEFVEI